MPDPRSLRAKLDKHAGDRADIEYARYVRPLGDRGLHVVQMPHSTTERVVGSTAGRKTFAPGTMVPLGSEQHAQQKIILGEPPPGRRGGSAFALFNPGAGVLEGVGFSSYTPEPQVGVSNQVITFIGYGFLSTDTWQFVVYNATTKTWNADPLRTAHDLSVTSTVLADIQVDYAATVPLGSFGTLQVTR